MSLLPPAKEVGGKVMFLHVSVILFIGLGGGWLPSMHHRSHEQPPGGGGWLPSMHHWSHDQGVCIQERKGVCIGGVCIQMDGLCIQGRDLHPGEGSASRGRGLHLRGGVCIQEVCMGVGWLGRPLVHPTPPLPPEFGKQVVHLLLESFLVHKSKETK